MAKKTFFQGAVILTTAMALSKLLGAIFRIPLTNMIGADGMAYYQAVYPIYVILLTVSIAGYPVAISRMVSERLTFGDHYGAHRAFRIALGVMVALGTVSFLVMWFFAETFSGFTKNMGSVYGMRAIAPALFFVPIMSAFMGYFQGMRNMRPSAATQVTEQLFRVAAGLTLALVLVGKSKEYAAAGANFGATAGAFAGLLLMLLIYLAKVKKPGFREKLAECKERFGATEQPLNRILIALFSITIPIMIGASIMPIMNYLDAVIVSNRLTAAGWDPVEVRSMYGQLSAMASSIINLPQALTQTIAVSLVPTVIAAFKTRDHEFLGHNITLSMRMCVIISLPCAVGVVVLAEPIMKLLYPYQMDDAIAAAPGLQILAAGIVFLACIQTLTGVLQGVERQGRPVLNLFIGAGAKVIITYTLTGIRSINILGAAMGTVAAYIIAATLDYRAVKRFTRADIEWKLVLLRPLVSAAVMGGCAFGAYKLCNLLVGNSVSTLFGVLAGGLVYVVMVFVTGAIRPDELAMLPKGEKLAKLFGKRVDKKRRPRR
ncbi:MAG: polysaccharide biosynthesis protein, partial [Clostridiales Family XIII bacterium]|jgi:stage V sporulation protein B|nr:polysaccharide biosynthesis protein [Clostridiales Family XIII bacterium]